MKRVNKRIIKKETRKNIIKKRDELDKEDKKIMDDKIIGKLIDSEEYKKARGIFTYIGFGSEIDTKIIIEDALKLGKEVYVPKIFNKEMLLIRIDSLENLVKSSYGILEPIGEENDFDIDKLDLIVMPGVAFDEEFNRLGYGAGYYDKFLDKNNLKCSKITLAYELQVLDRLEVEEHDKKVDQIITEKRIMTNNI